MVIWLDSVHSLFAAFRSKETRELLSRHPLPSKPTKVLKQALSLLTPRVTGLDSGLDLAVEVSHIDYEATYKYDLVSHVVQQCVCIVHVRVYEVVSHVTVM